MEMSTTLPGQETFKMVQSYKRGEYNGKLRANK